MLMSKDFSPLQTYIGFNNQVHIVHIYEEKTNITPKFLKKRYISEDSQKAPLKKKIFSNFACRYI